MRICRAHNLEESPASIITRTPDLFAPQSGVLTLVYCDLCLPEGVTPPPSVSGIPVNYGPASRILVYFGLESRILIDKMVQE